MASNAIQSALALFREPGRIADFRDRPLPSDVGQVIRVAAGEAAAIQAARESTEENAETLAEACIFYLQQMLFVANADSYRVLGMTSDATQQQLREHYRWLMRWLHPDRNPDGWEVVYADRVNAAWQDLKTTERRAEYDVRAPGDPISHGLAPVGMGAPIRMRPQAPDAHRPFLSGATVRRLPTIIFGALSISALAVLGLMYWAQVDPQREIDLAAQRANDATPFDARGDGKAAVTTDAVAAVQEMLAPASEPVMPQPNPPAAEQVAVPVAGDTQSGLPNIAMAVDQAADSSQVAPNTAPAASQPVDANAPTSAEPALIAVTTIAAPAEPIDTAPLGELVVTKEPLVEVTPTTPIAVTAGALDAITPSLQLAPTPPASLPPASLPLAIATPDPVDSNAETPVVRPTTLVATTKPAPPAAEEPILNPPVAKPALVVVAKEPARDPEAEVIIPPAVSPAAATAAPVLAVADAVVALKRTVAPSANPVVEPTGAPPARNDAQKLVGEMASAYASGNLARFDNLFVQSSAAGAGGMRNRMQSTQMRYLEMGEVDWSLTHDSAVGRVRYRDTFVPRGAKKAVTQAGQIHLTVRVDSGRARISSLEVASVAN